MTLPALLERDAELAAAGVAADAAGGGAGRLLVVEGVAGAGKSALLGAMREQAAAAGLRVLAAGAAESRREFPFGAIRQLFGPVLAALGDGARARLLAGAAAPAGWVVPADADADAGAAHADAGFAVLNGIYWLTANLAAEQPLFLVVDDLHWADEASVRSLAHLARRLEDLPVVLTVAMRPDEPGAPAAVLDELRSHAGAARIAPGSLSAAAVATIVRRRAPGASDALCAACHVTSGGNPLYLDELLRTLEGDGALTTPDAARIAAETSIPTLGEHVAGRVAKVDPAAPALARAISVVDDGGALALASRLAGLDDGAAAAIAHELVRIEVLASDDPVVFVHPLVRRSLYDAIGRDERDELHAAAARLLRERGASAEALAAHLGRVSPAGSAEVATTLHVAAGDASARAAPEAAAGHLRRALAEGATEPPRAQLLAELSYAELAVRDPAVFATLRESLELAESPALRARLTATLSELLCSSGQWEEGTELLDRSIRELGEPDPGLVVELEAIRAITSAYDPRLRAAFDRRRPRVAELSRGHDWPAVAMRVLLAAVDVQRGDDVDSAEGIIASAVDDGLMTGRPAAGWAAAQALTALVCAERHAPALALAELTADEGRRTGSLLGVVTGVGYRGHDACRRGELVAAEADLRTIIEIVVSSGMSMWLTSVLFYFTEALVERPELDDVAELAESAALEPAFLRTSSGAMLLECRGGLRLVRGDRDGAVADLRAATEVNRALGLGPTATASRSTLALALASGSADEARALVEEELELARRTGLGRPEGVALRAAGALAGGGEGIELLRASVGALAGTEAQLEHARSLAALGAALRSAGFAKDAREPLATAVELADRCGATRLADRVIAEQHAAGARPRRRSRIGVAALSASELRVAELAAHGMTNIAIAQELFLSTKTVETQLSGAYRKLGLAGRGARAQLDAALHP
jgi:DNA-binding CsgD family transcriptional regulator